LQSFLKRKGIGFSNDMELRPVLTAIDEGFGAI